MNPEFETMQQSVGAFMYRVYAWMAFGLALTGVTAYLIFANQPIFKTVISNPFIFFGLMIAQIVAVILLVSLIQKMNFATAAFTFIVYSILTGITFSTIFAAYELGSIYLVFGITMGMFAFMALYGFVTKTDLTKLGNILLMALFGLIIGMVVNIFMKSSTFDFYLSALGVIIFTGLIAYDVQKIKQMGNWLLHQGQDVQRVALLGALTLYLDFINLFLNLLNLLGKRKD
jgi:uncharacterized protein